MRLRVRGVRLRHDEAMSVQPIVDIGTDFLGYRIEELIGRGGMGVVYRAYDLRLKRPVALKLVAPALARDARFRERFARESELAMSLEHPNVVPVYDAGDADGRLYLAMRLVDGIDLGSLLRSEGRLEPARAVAICRQVAAALDAAHTRGLVHRDVKPSNVLLDPTEHVYLADFGLTRRLDEEAADVGDGHSLGTPAYLAPEQLEGGPIDGRADVYSLGCLLYECLTGERVFERASRLAVVWAHLEEEPPEASRQNNDLPQAIDGVIARAMAKAPEDRYPTCGALAAAADDALGLRRPARSRRRVWALAVAAILAAAGVAVSVAVLTRGGSKAAAPQAHDNTLVRIDPSTNTVSRVIDVSLYPGAVAVAGRHVWVYARAAGTVSEIDPSAGRVRYSTAVPTIPTDLSTLTGPVLAADPEGAWIVGVDSHNRFLLTRVRVGGGRRDFALDGRPEAVAVGDRAVWVLVRGARGDQLLRVDPQSGKVTRRARFRAGSHVDGLALGLGSVWAVASSTAMLYRVDPRSVAVSGKVDLGTRAGRPSVRFGAVWAQLSDRGGDTVLVDPRTLAVDHLDCCPLKRDSFDAGGFGSTWSIDSATGTVVRWDGTTYQVDKVIQITDPPFYDGSCLTSIAVGAGAVWVTLEPSLNYACIG